MRQRFTREHKDDFSFFYICQQTGSFLHITMLRILISMSIMSHDFISHVICYIKVYITPIRNGWYIPRWL